jgi:hypothetical protein
VRLCLILLLLACTPPAAAQARLAVAVEGVAVMRNAAARGFSAVNLRFDASYWLLAKPNVLHHVHIDWQRGVARSLDSHTLPALNVDGLQVLADSAWFAEERGPHLVEADLHGRLLGRYATLVDGAAASAAELRRGFGGLAASRDGRYLYAAFEGALWRGAAWESTPEGREYVRVLEFDLATRRWTGRSLRYPLEANGNTLAGLRFVDARTALVVERGAGLRRIYRVLVDAGALVKVAFVELGPLALGSVDGVEIVEPGYIVLTSAERSEIVLLRAPDLLFPAFERSRP